MFFTKQLQKKYNMNIKTADATLQNVFAACERKPSEIPFNKILLRSRLNLLVENICIIVISVFLVATLVSPVFFPGDSTGMAIQPESTKELKLIDHKVEDNEFIMTFDGNPIDLEKSYMVDSSDTKIQPDSYDALANVLTFQYDTQEYNIYIYDINGNLLHLLLSPRK